MSDTQENAEVLMYRIKQLCDGFTVQVVVSALCHVMLEAADACSEHITKERFLGQVAKSWDHYYEQKE